MKSRARLFAAGLTLLLLASAACGRKTYPIIPDSPRPAAVNNIKAITRGAFVFLTWPIPTKNIEGRSLNPADIQVFRIYRADFGRDRKKAHYKLHAEIDMAKPSPAIVQNGMVNWTDDQVQVGYLYGYRIRVVSVRGGISALSEEVRVRPLLTPAIPAGLKAQEGDGYNLITWQTVTTWTDNSPYDDYVGYNIYRGSESGRYEETPLNKEPLKETSYKDTSTINNRTYYYIVRSVNNPTPPWKESLDSEAVSATPRDLTPPGRPTGLTAVPGIGRVFLTWNENKELDLAGYYVYRSTGSDRDFKRLTDKLLTRTTYSDETVTSGTYYYVITAVDQSGNESAHSQEKKVLVENLNTEDFKINTQPKKHKGN